MALPRYLSTVIISLGWIVGNQEVYSQPPAVVKQFEDAVKAAAAKAEHAIASIQVSRSPKYKELGAAPETDLPGKLGNFFLPSEPQRRRGFGFRQQQPNPNAWLDLSSPESVPDSFGSGVVVDSSGLVLTLAHVVKDAVKIYVRFSGGAGSYADIHALDGRSDLAVLRLLNPPEGLAVLPMGDPSTLAKGQFAILMSNSFASGFRDGSPAVSWGMVSNLRRKLTSTVREAERNQLSLYHYGTLIQADAAVKPGISGGALLDFEGRWVGILTTHAAWTGADSSQAFAIPLDRMHRGILEKLKGGEEVDYGFLGVQIQPHFPGATGVQISNVTAGSPAQRAGITRGDTITGINGEPIRHPDDLFLHVGGALAGSNAKVEIVRGFGDARQVLQVKLAKFANANQVIASKQPPALFGIRADYSSIISQVAFGQDRFNYFPEGVAVREVVPGSPADKGKIQQGNLITRVNDQPVTTPQEYLNAVAKSGKQVKITIHLHNGGEDILHLEMPAGPGSNP
ncbi:MAG: PDZ domain-containing protein [Gemmataceae bacterium]|nr:PDZ domain-containing protein [Gemmataceae bacterium]